MVARLEALNISRFSEEHHAGAAAANETADGAFDLGETVQMVEAAALHVVTHVLPRVLFAGTLALVGWWAVGCFVRALERRLKSVRVPEVSTAFGAGEASGEEKVDGSRSDCSSSSVETAQEKGLAIDPTLLNFGMSLIGNGLRIVLLLCVASVVGIHTGSVLTIFATCTLAIGLALQGLLQDFARGVMLTLLRPYGLGDHIEIVNADWSVAGKVVEMGMFQTILRSDENVSYIIPNNMINVITNNSGMGMNRLDLTVKTSRDEDMKKVKETLILLATTDRHVHESPEPPTVFLSELTEDLATYVLRVWVRSHEREKFPRRFKEAALRAFKANDICLKEC